MGEISGLIGFVDSADRNVIGLRAMGVMLSELSSFPFNPPRL